MDEVTVKRLEEIEPYSGPKAIPGTLLAIGGTPGKAYEVRR